MLKRTFVIFALLWSGSVFSQDSQQVSALILDAGTFLPIGHASITLLHQSNKQVADAMQSRENGGFVFTNVNPGTYMLRVTFMGYNTFEQENILVRAGQSPVQLGNIYLEQVGQAIDEVVVRSDVPAIQLGIDRRIFNVAQSMVSVGGTASDLLGNVPSIQVDMDGSVSLRGSSSVKILIDGKESSLAGTDITQLLQSMPASSIERVEVVTNPSSRYDAEGQSGIINIVLKKNLRTGLNGAVNASAGSYENFGFGTNLNYRDNRFNYFGNFNFNRRNSIGDGMNTTRLLSTNSQTNNISKSRRLGLNNSIKLGVDYYLTDKTTIGLAGDMSIRNNDRQEDIFYTYLNHPSLSGNSERFSKQDEDDFGFDLNLDFRHEFSRAQEELTANMAYGKSVEDGTNIFDQEFTGTSSEQRLNTTGEDGRKFNVQVDYSRPFGEMAKLELGYRSIVRLNADHQFSELALNGGSMLPDYAVSNDFEMNNQVHAVYANYQRKLTEKLGMQVGLRAEQAYLNTSYFVLDPAVPVSDRKTEGTLDYFRVYPSIFLTQEFGEQNQLQASYTRRVNRPRGWQVNPFIDVSDPLNIRQGNPGLLPEDIHSFELSYAKFWNKVTLTSSAYYRRMNDVVQPIITTVSGSDGATFSQWENISRNETTGFEFISKIDFHKNVDMTANINAFHSRFNGSEAFNIAPTEGLSWNANATANVRITPVLSAQSRFEYQAPRIMAQGKGVENYVVDAGIRWDVLSKKGSVMFNVRDLLNQRRWGGYTQTQHIYREYESRWMKRMFTLSFNYRFGQQDFQRKDNRRQDNMDDFGGGEAQF